MIEPPLRCVVDQMTDVRVIVPTTDLAVSDFHDRHEGMVDDLTGVEHPALHVLPDDHVALGHEMLRKMEIAAERLDADAETTNDVCPAGGAHWVHAHIGVMAVRGEERGHEIPIAPEVRVPVTLDDLAVACFEAVHGSPLA